MKTTDQEKWTRLARFQEKIPGSLSVHCRLCPHNCVVAEGKSGLCRTRVNRQGELLTIAYGNPCSIAVDPIEKKPLFHFFPGEKILSLATAGCNFRCLNCQNWQISQSSPIDLNHYDLMPENVVEEVLKLGLDMIAFTYTEPTVFYEYLYDIARIAKAKGVKTVFISNGFINQEPLLELCPYLDAANIDLKCLDDAVYRRLDGGKLQPVLDTLKILKENGIWLEVTNLLVPEYTDRPEQIEALCQWLVDNGFEDTPIHFSRFFPNYKLQSLPPTDVSRLLEAKRIAETAGLKYVYVGNLPTAHEENTFCPDCRQMLIERIGYSIQSNHIEHNKCRFCGTLVAGVWS